MRVALGLVGILSGAGCDRVFALGPPPGADSPRGLVFDNSDSPADLREFPVLVALDPSVIDYEVVVDPRTDLRFVDPDTGSDLAFDVDHWEPGDASFVWVRVPQIDAASRSDGILMYFGRGVAGTALPATDTWAGHELVFHGEDDRNAAGPAYPAGRSEDVTYEPGLVGNAVRLRAGDDSRLGFEGSEALFDGWPTFTFELAIRPDYELATLPTPQMGSQPPHEPDVLTMDGPLYLGRLRSVTATGPLIMQLDFGFAGEPTAYTQQYTPHQVWSHLVYTYDGTALIAYRNGVFSGFDVRQASLGATGNLLVLGHPDDAMDGWLDELRVSRTPRTPEWVYAEFLNLTGRFVTFVPGDELPL